jgi:predicted nucleic acid-binding protein
MKMFILDSYSLLCLFDKKRRAEKKAVTKYLEDAEKGSIKLYISKVNEGEVFYKLYTCLGGPISTGFREDLRRGLFPLNVIPVNDRRVEEASMIRAKFPVSYADAFCIELAKDMNLPVITGAPEFACVKNFIQVVEL